MLFLIIYEKMSNDNDNKYRVSLSIYCLIVHNNRKNVYIKYFKCRYGHIAV